MSTAHHHRSLTRSRSGARPRACATRLDACDRRPRRARAASSRPPSCPSVTEVTAVAGDVARSPASRGAARPRRHLDRPARQQRLAAEGAERRPSMRPSRELARLPDRGSCADVLRGQRARATGADPAGAAVAGRRRGRDQHHLRCGRRAVSRAGAATDPRRRRSISSPRSSPPSSRACASTRSTPATCARGCTRRRSPARTSPIGRRRRTAFPGLLALIDGARRSGRYSARELASASSRGGGLVSCARVRAADRGSRRPSPRSSAACRRDGVRLMVADRHAGTAAQRPLRRAPAAA